MLYYNNNIAVENKKDQTEDDRKIIRLLSVLLSKDKNVEARKEIMNKEFQIPMTEEITKVVEDMCNLGYSIEIEALNKGKRKGKTETQLKDIRSLMETMNLSVTEAMNALKIPEKERKGLLKKLETTT